MKKHLNRLRHRHRPQAEANNLANNLADGLEHHLRRVIPSENATHGLPCNKIPRNDASGSNDTSGRVREHLKRSELRDELDRDLREAEGLIRKLEAIERQGRRLNQREIERARDPNLLRPIPIGPN